MSVAYGATGTILNTASATPLVAYPAGITAGQMLIAVAYTFEAGGTILSGEDGFSFLGKTDITASVEGHVFYKEADGSESGTMDLNPDATIDVVAHISRFTKTLGAWDTIDWAIGTETSSAPEWSMTTLTALERVAGDMLIAVAAGNGGTSVRTWSSETIDGSAVTGVLCNTHRTGINMQGHTSYRAAPSTANSVITHEAELSVNMAGEGMVLRLRDLSTHTDKRMWGSIPIKADS